MLLSFTAAYRVPESASEILQNLLLPKNELLNQNVFDSIILKYGNRKNGKAKMWSFSVFVLASSESIASVPFSINAALFSLIRLVRWTPQKTSWLLTEDCVVSESLQSQKTLAKDIPGLFTEQETAQLTSTDLACRYPHPWKAARQKQRAARQRDAQLGRRCCAVPSPGSVVPYFLWTGLWAVFAPSSAGAAVGYQGHLVASVNCSCLLLTNSQNCEESVSVSLCFSVMSQSILNHNPSLYFFLHSVKQGQKPHVCFKYCDRI